MDTPAAAAQAAELAAVYRKWTNPSLRATCVKGWWNSKNLPGKPPEVLFADGTWEEMSAAQNTDAAEAMALLIYSARGDEGGNCHVGFGTAGADGKAYAKYSTPASVGNTRSAEDGSRGRGGAQRVSVPRLGSKCERCALLLLNLGPRRKRTVEQARWSPAALIERPKCAGLPKLSFRSGSLKECSKHLSNLIKSGLFYSNRPDGSRIALEDWTTEDCSGAVANFLSNYGGDLMKEVTAAKLQVLLLAKIRAVRPQYAVGLAGRARPHWH